jgi:putative hydrolase of the HAD superfamily
MLDNYEGIVFDVDDTLYLEQDYVRSGFDYLDKFVFEKYGIEWFGRSCWLKFEEGRRGNIFDGVLQDFEIDSTPQLLQDLVSLYRSHSPSISLLPDSIVLLESLRGQKSIGFLTGGPAQGQLKKIEALGLAKYSDFIVLSGDRGIEFDKPHPQSWNRISELMGMTPASLVYLGDNPDKDFRTPVGMGWGAIRVRRTGGEHESKVAIEGIAEVRNFDDL